MAAGILLLALALRLGLVLVLEPSPSFKGGDANWYMINGRDLVTTGKTAGPLQPAPLYPVALGMVQVIVPGEPDGDPSYTHTEMQVIRVLQALLGAALCLFVYGIARRLFSRRAAELTGVILAISPALIIEAGNLTTESFFMFFVTGGLALYTWAQHNPTPRRLIAVGVMLGLATLTRAVFLLFPLGLAVHLLLIHRAHGWRLVAALLVTYSVVISSWTIYNWLTWERLVIGGEGILGFLYQGATGKASPQDLDAGLDLTPENADGQREEAMQAGIEETIREDPIGWAAHRVRELTDAYLQPHNTNHLKGKSFRAAASEWLRHDRSLAGLLDLTRIESFWPKLALYIFHFGGLILGAAGMWISRWRWRDLLPLVGLIAYFTGIHLLLLALPRYVFPTYPAFWIFAAVFILAMWDRRRQPRPT